MKGVGALALTSRISRGGERVKNSERHWGETHAAHVSPYQGQVTENGPRPFLTVLSENDR